MYLKFKVGTYYTGSEPQKLVIPQMTSYKYNFRSLGIFNYF